MKLTDKYTGLFKAIIQMLLLTLLLMSILMASVVITGCSTTGNSRVSKYKVDCSQCTFEMMYDKEDDNQNLDIKGF